MERSIQTPDWEWGTAEQCARWVGIGTHVWDALAQAGKIPPGARHSRQAHYWHWAQVVAISGLLDFLVGRTVKTSGAAKDAEG